MQRRLCLLPEGGDLGDLLAGVVNFKICPLQVWNRMPMAILYGEDLVYLACR